MGHLVMSEKERLRKAVFEMVKQGKLTLVMAASAGRDKLSPSKASL